MAHYAELPLCPTKQMTLQRLTFLVVYDLELMRAVTVNQLRAMGCDRIRVARNGIEAMDLLRVQKVDAVLADWNMPVMSGLALFKAMRADPQLARLPFLMITAETERQRIEELIAAGVSSLLVKPYTVANLRARIERLLSDAPRTPAAGPDAGAASQLVSDGSPASRQRLGQLFKGENPLQAEYDALLEAGHRREEAEHISRHDIKGSLAGIVGMVQSLADDDSMAPRHVSQLRLVEQTALQVMDMVNLAGELFKIESGQFQLKALPVEVGPILHRIVELSRSTFYDKGLSIAVDTDTPVGVEMPKAVGDAMLCYSLFQNLIKNACEAAPPGTRVSVTLKDENPLRVVIQNSGAVPPELRARFFEKFATQGKEGGSGLGTYSARLLANAQHGSVSMSTADNATTLTITLPRHAFEAAQPIP